MMSLRRLIGMPVVWQGAVIGYVERGVLAPGGKSLRGIVLRRGLQGARWVARENVEELGSACVLARAQPVRPPKTAEISLSRVYHTDGQCLGMVTDALIDRRSLRVTALEVSYGPLYQLLGRHAYATCYRVRPVAGSEGEGQTDCEVIAAGLVEAVRHEEGREAEMG